MLERIAEVSGLTLAEGLIDPETCGRVAAAARAEGWREMYRKFCRRDYGYDYNITSRSSTKLGDGSLPAWLTELLPALREAGWTGPDPDRVLVTQYPEGSGALGRHIDSAAFGPVIAGVTVEGGMWPIWFTRNGRLPVRVNLPLGSIYVMQGDARTSWFHEIRETAGWGPRMSLTYRTGA